MQVSVVQFRPWAPPVRGSVPVLECVTLLSPGKNRQRFGSQFRADLRQLLLASKRRIEVRAKPRIAVLSPLVTSARLTEPKAGFTQRSARLRLRSDPDEKSCAQETGNRNSPNVNSELTFSGDVFWPRPALAVTMQPQQVCKVTAAPTDWLAASRISFDAFGDATHD